MARKPKVIAIANQKGGIGKTTTATSIAAILNKWGHKTLLIDTDVQCNCTDTLQAQTDNVATLYDLIIDDEPCALEEAIQHTQYGDIIAADPGLEEAEIKLQSEDAFFKLKDAIDGLKGYEYVVIDTNPSVNCMLYNALVAANEIIIPMSADRYPMKGLAQLTNTITKVQGSLNPGLKIKGLLLSRFNERANLNKDTKEALENVAAQVGTKVFKTYIRESIKVRESQTERMPLAYYAPRCTAQKDYEELVKEMGIKNKNS